MDGPAALPREIPFLFLAEGACGEQEMDTVPRGQGNGKCRRTSCSWETFRLVVCALETWLLVFFCADLWTLARPPVFLSRCVCSPGSGYVRGAAVEMAWTLSAVSEVATEPALYSEIETVT